MNISSVNLHIYEVEMMVFNTLLCACMINEIAELC